MRISFLTPGWVVASFIALGACGGGSNSNGSSGQGSGSNLSNLSGSSSGSSLGSTGSSVGGTGSSLGGTGSSVGGTGSSLGGTGSSLGGSGAGTTNNQPGPTGDDGGPQATGDDGSTPATGDDGSTPATGDDGSAGSSGSGASSGSSPPPPNSDCWTPTMDFTSPGPYTPMQEAATTAACTIWRPAQFNTKAGCTHPVVVWGNGTINVPTTYTGLFNHWASHGLIVAAANTSNAGSGKEMIACMNYMLQQATASGSAFAGHVDTAHMASSGYSQGGAGCLEAGEDPHFTTVAAVSPFIILPLGGYDESSASKQTHPLFMISGSADTVATPAVNQAVIFGQAKVPIVWATHAGSTHFEVLGSGGAYAGPLTAWFRYKLMGDMNAKNWFEKPPCDLCTAPGWSVQFNSLWM